MEPQSPRVFENADRSRGKSKDTFSSSNLKITKLFLKAMLLGKAVFLSGVVKPVQSRDEFSKVLGLLYREYRKKSLCRENNRRELFNIYTFMKESTTLVLNKRNRLLGTVMCIEDGPKKLPADDLYEKELNILRRKGYKLVEIGSLALDQSKFKKNRRSLKSFRKLGAMITLFNGLLNYLYQFTDCTHLVIMVNPRHTEIYNLYGFEQFAEIRHYGKVDKPAVPMILDFEAFIASADTNIIALSVVKMMKVLGRIRKFHFSAADIAQKIEDNPLYFRELSSAEEHMLLSQYPEVSAIYKLNKYEMLEKNKMFELPQGTTHV